MRSDLLTAFPLALLLWLAGAGLAKILNRISGRRLDRWELLLIAGPLGAYVVCWLLFAALSLKVVRLDTGLAQWGVCLIAVPLGGLFVSGLSRSWKRPRLGIVSSWRTLPGWAGALAILLTALAFGYTVEAFCRPVVSWDARSYRFPFAHIVFTTGFLPDFASPSSNDCFAYPPTPMLIYSLIWAWLGRVNVMLPKLVNLFFAASTLAWIYIICTRILRSSGGLAILAVALASIQVPIRLSAETSDWMLTFWSLAALYFVLARDGRSWFWAGICAGMALMTKHHGIVSLACLMAAAMLVPIRLRSRLLGIAAVAALAILISAPWLIRNWVLWQNPIYPAALPVLGGWLYDDWVGRYVWPFWQQPHLGYRWLHAFFSFIRIGLLLPLAAGPFIAAYRQDIRRETAALWIYFAVGLAFYLVLGMAPNGGGVRLFSASWITGICLMPLVLQRLNDEQGSRAMRWALYLALAASAFVLTRDVINGMSDDHWLWDRVDGHERGPLEIVTYFLWPLFVLFLWLFRDRLKLLGPVARPGVSLGLALLIVGWPFFLDKPVRGVINLVRDRPAAIDWERSPPWETYGDWAERNLPAHAVLLTFNNQRWVIPRTVLSGDSPLLQPAYRDGAGPQQILPLLARLGVTHVIENDNYQAIHPLNHKGPLWDLVGQSPHFEPVYCSGCESQNPVTVYRVRYTPEQRELLESNIERPWLYGYAASGPVLQ